MHISRLSLVMVLAGASACSELAPTAAAPPVEYRPELAGTVDHAMCLLGFVAAPLRTIATGHQLVDGALNGKPATFVLDTGANVSVVHAAYAEDFGLTPQRGVAGAAIGLGGGMRTTRSRIDTLRIGTSEIRQSHLMVADLSQLQTALSRLSKGPIHGIIGQDLMTEHRAVIDVARPMFYLRQDDSDPAPAPAERCQAVADEEASGT